MVESGIPGHQYVFRRNIADGELAYFHCYNPRGEGLSELVRVIGSRWPIEECFEAAKQEAGLDQYQFRLYKAWYRPITLAMLALQTSPTYPAIGLGVVLQLDKAPADAPRGDPRGPGDSRDPAMSELPRFRRIQQTALPLVEMAQFSYS
jgi:hypothetical protein